MMIGAYFVSSAQQPGSRQGKRLLGSIQAGGSWLDTSSGDISECAGQSTEEGFARGLAATAMAGFLVWIGLA